MKINVVELPVFYINLDEKVERREAVEQLLKEYGFKNFERFPATRAEGRSIGCSTSHAKVLEHIVDNDIYPALILEDDVDIFAFRKTIECPDDADAMYVGFSRYGYNHNQDEPFPRSLKIKELGENYHRVYNMLARHAVIHFNKEYDLVCIEAMNDFIKEPTNHVAGDIALAKIHPEHKVYCQNLPIFYQNDSKTRSLTKRSLRECEFIEMEKL